MIQTTHIEVWGWEHAIRGMRNPLNSWDKSDTVYGLGEDRYNDMVIGENDLSLMQRLFKGGTEHRKYLRQIFVSLDITAPLYWWKEFDTYKVGTVANSCSTMHKIQAKEFTLDDFSHEHLSPGSRDALETIIYELNRSRSLYQTGARGVPGDDWSIPPKDKHYWWQMIQLLPTSYNQKRTVTMSYENVFTILRQRKGHKLDEWNILCETLLKLPYVKQIGGMEDDL